MSDWPPKKNTTFTVTFPLLDNDGDLVSSAAGLDSEVSKDGGAFTDCTNEAAEIGSSGMYSLALTAAEMNADVIAVIVKTSTANAKTTPLVFYTVTNQLTDINTLLTRALGLTQENHYIDNTTFTTGKLTAARIRIYSVAGSVGTASDVIATYNIVITYDANGNMETYKVTKA